MKTISLCLIVPCYNEEKRLNLAKFEDFLNSHRDISICFVNDGSKDQTLNILKEFSNSNERASFLDLSKNGGKAEAVRQGFLHHIDKDFDYIGYWDADLATPLSEVDPIFNMAIKHNAISVMGSRILRLGGNINRVWYRHILGRTFATSASILLNLPIYDTQCGAKIFNRELYTKIFNEAFNSYWLFDVELLFRIKDLKGQNVDDLRIYEYPLSSWKDETGSKLKITDFLKAPFELIKIYLKHRK